MIDVENQVYTILSDALETAFPGIYVTGEYVNAPNSFPCVGIMEKDNYPVRLDSGESEKYSLVMYEVEAYSNRASGKKTECKNIMQLVNETMHSLNFKRLAQTPVPNLFDASIYRIAARYRAETDGKYFYRR